MNASAQVNAGMRQFHLMQNLEARFGVDMTGDYERGFTNPLWFDLSPIAPVENGVPLMIKNRGFVPLKQGWFQGSYAASATDFDFSTGAKLSSGTTAKPQRLLPQGLPIPALQLPILDRIRGGDPEARPMRDLLVDPLTTIRNMASKQFNERVAELHADRVQPLFVAGLAAMKQVALRERLTDADGKVDYLDAFTWDRFNHSDGVVDYEPSMGVCERGLEVEDKTRNAVASCTVFKDINHLQFSGTAYEVAADIVNHLVR